LLRQAFQSSVYSTTAQDWRLAGELAIGEQVLTYAGSATLTGKRPAPAQRVYNLEVQEVHNFLVTGVGVVVHNSYNYNWTKKLDYFENGVPTGPKLPLEHIWDRHSYVHRQPGTSYFRAKYNSREKVKGLIEDITNNTDLEDIKKVHYTAGKVDWIKVDARKVLDGPNDFIGKDRNGSTTRYLKVVVDHIDEHGKIIPKTAYPVD